MIFVIFAKIFVMATLRWEQKLDSFTKALNRLAEVVNESIIKKIIEAFYPEMLKFHDKMENRKAKCHFEKY